MPGLVMIPNADGGTVKDSQGANRGNSLRGVGFRIKKRTEVDIKKGAMK